MKMAYEVHSVAHIVNKNGRGKRGKQQVIDITPIILTEIRDGIRDLSTRMDRLEVRMSGLEVAFGAFKPDVERRLSALEAAVFRKN